MNSWFSAESFSGLNLPLLSDWGFLNTKFWSCFFHSNFNFINISSALIGNFYEPSLFPRMLVAKPPSYPTAVTAKPNLPLILLFRWCNDVARSKFDSCQLIDDCWLEQYCWWNHKAGYSKSHCLIHPPSYLGTPLVLYVTVGTIGLNCDFLRNSQRSLLPVVVKH